MGMKKCKKGRCYRWKHFIGRLKKRRAMRRKRWALRKKCRKCIRSRGRFGCKGKCSKFKRRYRPRSMKKCKKGRCYRWKHFIARRKKRRAMRKKRLALRKKCRKCIRSRGKFG